MKHVLFTHSFFFFFFTCCKWPLIDFFVFHEQRSVFGSCSIALSTVVTW